MDGWIFFADLVPWPSDSDRHPSVPSATKVSVLEKATDGRPVEDYRRLLVRANHTHKKEKIPDKKIDVRGVRSGINALWFAIV